MTIICYNAKIELHLNGIQFSFNDLFFYISISFGLTCCDSTKRNLVLIKQEAKTMKKLTKNGFVGAEVLTRAQLKKVLGGVEDGNPDGPPVEVGGGGGGDCLSRVHASFSDCMQCLIVEK